MPTEIVLIFVLILANGFFAGAEIAVLSIRKTRLQQLVEEGSRRARAVSTLRDKPEAFLATVQVGITVVGAAAAAFGGASLAERLTPLLQQAGLSADRAPGVALATVVVIISFLSLVLGELVPKSLALKFGERYALLVAGPLLFLSNIARPIIWLLTFTSNILLRPFGDKTTFTESRLSAEELRQMVEEAAQAGSLDRRAGEIAARAIEFEKLTAEDVMIPRGRMIAISRDASRDDLRKVLLEQRHSRMPVYERTLDRIVGYIAADDVLTDVLEGRELSIANRLRPVEIVPAVLPVTRVLQRLQKEHGRLAIAVDEFGGVAGLVTLEDLVEELVGDIRSENERAEAGVEREASGSILVPGHFPVRMLERLLAVDVPDGDFATVAGLCIQLAGKIPAVGEKVSLEDGTAFEVVEAAPHAVRKVRITPRPA